MSLSFAHGMLGAAALTFSLSAWPASTPASAPVIVDKTYAPRCLNSPDGEVRDPAPDKAIPHQYMLLLVFKHKRGSQYFGGPKGNEYGCIPDVPSTLVVAPRKQLTVENCPNDCVYPFGPRPATVYGTDPLNGDPKHTNKWGILSAIDPAAPTGGAGRHIEIWQIAVTDACHAHRLYAYHTSGKKSLFKRAYANKDMLGEILAGYLVVGNGDAASQPCVAALPPGA